MCLYTKIIAALLFSLLTTAAYAEEDYTLFLFAYADNGQEISDTENNIIDNTALLFVLNTYHEVTNIKMEKEKFSQRRNSYGYKSLCITFHDKVSRDQAYREYFCALQKDTAINLNIRQTCF